MPVRVVAAREDRRLLQVVGGEERQQVADVVEAGLVVGGDERGDARLGGVGHGAAQLLLADVLAGHRLHHVGTGDEHVAGLVDHEDEVGHGRAVDRAAGAGAHDHADLRRDARRQHVAVEDAAVGGEADRPLLDAGAGAVVEADDRRADLEREVHDLVDLLGEHLAEGAAEQREVLGEHEDLAAVDVAPAGDHAVGVGPLGDVGVAVPGEHVELVEAAFVEQVLDPLPGEHLAPVVLALDRPVRARLPGLLLALLELRESLGEGVIGHRSQGTGCGPLPRSRCGPCLAVRWIRSHPWPGGRRRPARWPGSTGGDARPRAPAHGPGLAARRRAPRRHHRRRRDHRVDRRPAHPHRLRPAAGRHGRPRRRGDGHDRRRGGAGGRRPAPGRAVGGRRPLGVPLPVGITDRIVYVSMVSYQANVAGAGPPARGRGEDVGPDPAGRSVDHRGASPTAPGSRSAPPSACRPCSRRSSRRGIR